MSKNNLNFLQMNQLFDWMKKNKELINTQLKHSTKVAPAASDALGYPVTNHNVKFIAEQMDSTGRLWPVLAMRRLPKEAKPKNDVTVDNRLTHFQLELGKIKNQFSEQLSKIEDRIERVGRKIAVIAREINRTSNNGNSVEFMSEFSKNLPE